jgi:gamma-glutamylcyclotransferase (GGCT)/AIG2-like uncharacterized protein YtfP
MLKVFVYGTLKPGESNYERFCAGKVLQAQRAIARGHLYALPIGYPAMTPGDREVHGFLLTFTDNEILHHLDRLEDYNPHRYPEQNEYNRQLIETFNLSGQPLATAWTYLMTREQVQRQGGIFLPSAWWSGCGLYTIPYCKSLGDG